MTRYIDMHIHVIPARMVEQIASAPEEVEAPGVRAETRQHSRSSPKQLGRLYFDSLLFDPQALRYLMDLVGAEHVCIGTDAPFDIADERPLDTIAAVPRITEHERHELCCGTALRLL